MRPGFRMYAMLVAAGFAAAFLLSGLSAATKHTEAELLQELSSPDEARVYHALQELEKEYPDSQEARTRIIALLKDPRERVHRKAARVLGAIGVHLSDAQIGDVVSLLSSPDKDAVIDGLKALRGLGNKSAAKSIAPLLKNADKNIKRDSCRTLAVLGDKSVIPEIEPLLNDPDKKVQQDAREAIAQLKAK